jgi:WD40 repeat protein
MRTIAAHEETITSVLYLADNRTVVSSCEDDIIKLWKADTGECIITLDGRGDGIYSLAAGPKPHTFLAGRKDGAVVLWMMIYSLTFP